MKLKFLALTATLITTNAFANGFEYTLDSSARSYSAGLSIIPSAAYKFSLWGEEGSPFEGAIRPKINADLSPATYSTHAELEFSPVTFINIAAGRKLYRRFSHFDDDACKNNNCVGSLNSTDVSIKALFKVSAIMGSIKFTKTFYDSIDDKSQKLVEPINYLLISPTNEVANAIEAIVGTPVTESWFTGVMIQNVELRKSDANQNGQYLLVMKKNGHASYIVGGGRFESELKDAKPSFIFSFKYDWQ